MNTDTLDPATEKALQDDAEQFRVKMAIVLHDVPKAHVMKTNDAMYANEILQKVNEIKIILEKWTNS